jgi:hypothetical protein
MRVCLCAGVRVSQYVPDGFLFPQDLSVLRSEPTSVGFLHSDFLHCIDQFHLAHKRQLMR